MDDDRQYDCLVIGGGISGISFAHYLKQQGKKVLILEKKTSIGGQIQSPTAEVDANYWREMGAHTCYNSYTHLLSIVKDLRAEEHIQALGKGSYVIYAGGKIKSPMSQIQYTGLLFNGIKLFFTSRKGKTVKEYFGNIVGKRNYRHLFSRLFRAVLSQNADEYPAESFLKRRAGRFEEFPRKYTFSKGLHSFLQLMVEKNNIDVKPCSEILDIQQNEDKSQYTVTTIDGCTYTSNNIAFATSPNTAGHLIGDIDHDLATLLCTIPMFHSESMNVIIPKDKLSIKDVAGIIPVSEEFHSAVSRDLVADKELRSFTFHFAHNAKNEDEKLETICEVLDIKKHEIVEYDEGKHILPSLQLEHLNLAEQVAELQENESMYILGNYFYGLSIEDCINRSSDEAKRFLMKK